MKLLAATVLSFSLVASASGQTITIARNGSQPSRPGPAENFTGSVRVDSPFQATDPARASGALVTFEPGARSAWHSHPLGQSKALARSVAKQLNGAHRHRGAARRQEHRLDGKSQ